MQCKGKIKKESVLSSGIGDTKKRWKNYCCFFRRTVNCYELELYHSLGG